MLPKDVITEEEKEDKQVPDPDTESDVNNTSSSRPVQSEDNVEASPDEKPAQPGQPLPKEPVTRTPNSSEVSLETHAEGEDGWQPVQRPRSSGLSGKRLRQRRQHGSKIFNHQKKDFVAEMDPATVKNNQQGGKLYFLKKRAVSAGSIAEYYVAKTSSSGTKYGRKVVKTVAYRVKSVSSPTMDAARGNSKNEDEALRSPSDPGPVSAQKEVVTVAKRSSIVSLGKSPSYKEVALAPPGTISMLQVREDDAHHNRLLDEPEQQHKEAQDKSVSMVVNAQNEQEENIRDLVLGSAAQLRNEKEALDKNEEIHSDNVKIHENLVAVSESIAQVHACHKELSHTEELGAHTDNVSNYDHSSGTGTSTEDPLVSNEDSKTILEGLEEQKLRIPVACQSDSREVSNKKLSALAAPYNPSVVGPRVAPLPMNISHPSGPGAVQPVGPWPMNMGIHPGHATILSSPISSPHHPYPSPPATPNMIHPLPFMYPPYTQPQSIPPSTFQVTSNPFHHSQFAWHNVRANTPEYIPVTVWPGCHPVEFPSPTVVEPIAEPVLEAKEHSINSENLNLASTLPLDLDTGNESKKEIDLPASEAVENLHDINVVQSVKGEEINESKFHGVPFTVNLLHNSNGPSEESQRCNDYHVQRQQWNADNEKTFNILVRGRRNRKQMLRMPISLLKRPYTSQPFKVVYSRVVKETELPRSPSTDSKETSSANAT